jgi:predicted nucleic acid-binding protein
MIRAIVLDSTPLGLLVNRPGFRPADECRNWLRQQLEAGVQVHIPAIVAYELRRELLRIDSHESLSLLDGLIQAEADRYLPLTDIDLIRAAEFWAQVRKQGRPTADRFALDIDVILAAQALSLGLPADQFVVATENVAHLALLVPAKLWSQI